MIMEVKMDFSIPKEISEYLDTLDDFIEKKIKPLENEDDNIRFFDHRREHSRTNWDNGGLPTEEWEELLGKMRKLADEAGHLRFGLPKEYGGKDGSNLAMAIIREHLAAKGLGLHNDLQNENRILERHCVRNDEICILRALPGPSRRSIGSRGRPTSGARPRTTTRRTGH